MVKGAQSFPLQWGIFSESLVDLLAALVEGDPFQRILRIQEESSKVIRSV